MFERTNRNLNLPTFLINQRRHNLGSMDIFLSLFMIFRVNPPQRAGGQCLLGQHLVFERRKSGDCCFNGKEYEREINISSCACGEDDFEW